MDQAQNPQIESVFTAMDNFHVEQLRLENQFLRERLRVTSQRAWQAERKAAMPRLAHANGCFCQLCRN